MSLLHPCTELRFRLVGQAAEWYKYDWAHEFFLNSAILTFFFLLSDHVES